MSTIRVIPRLDIKGPNLVKGIHLEGLRVLGRPEEFARYYYEHGADELIYQDVVASLFERNSLHECISRTVKDIFIPLTVGGGLRSLEDISAVLAAGADKVAINTAAIRNPDLISQAALRFGASTIVVAIESIRQTDGTYLAYTDNGREHTGIDAIEWARKAEELGAGEILATSVDRDGTGDGYDLEMTKNIADSVSITTLCNISTGEKTNPAKGTLNSFAVVVESAGLNPSACHSLKTLWLPPKPMSASK
jgi:cyclase